MGDIGIQFGASLFVPGRAVILQPSAALVAIGRPEVVLTAALWTMRGQLAARHGHKGTIGALDNLQVANDKTVVKGEGTESLETLARIFHELDAHLGDFHGRSPS